MTFAIDPQTGLYLVAGWEKLGTFETKDAARAAFMSMRKAA